MPFYVNSDPSQAEVSEAINYLLANINNPAIGNEATGQILGANGEVVAYLYKYLNVKYSTSFDGTENFSNVPTNATYYGLRNSESAPEPSSPAEYVWTKVTGGFGTTKFLWYVVTGGRNIQLQVAATKPSDGYAQDTGASIDLDNLTGPSFNPSYVIIYRAANDSSAPTDAEFQAAINRNPISGDTATINYNSGANSIQYKYTTSWAVMNKYITGDIIESLTGYYGAIETVTHEDFDTGLSNPTHKEGRVFYDQTNKSLAYYNDNSQVTVNLGQEQLVRVWNNTGATILNGKACYVNGGHLTFPTVALAQATSFAASNAVIGLATSDIADGAYGYITTSGIVHDVDTSAYTDGTTLYLSDTVAGGYTDVLPLQPSYNVILGYVTNQSATTGDIFVHVDKLPWFPSLQLLDATASAALPTTPTVFALPTVSLAQGFSYNTSTGVITVDTNGTYTMTLTINASPSAANKKVYAYLEEDTGSGWVINRYAARQIELANGTVEQINMIMSAYMATGTKIRFYLWGDATVTLTSVDVPGTTAGTVTLAAAQLSLA